MAIYSLRHTPIGRSTQSRPHTAAAHVGYISRPHAARHFMVARMPTKPKAAAAYLTEMENADRANARVADKVMLALPKELDQEQRVHLVRDFADDVTRGRASWLAAIHDKGKDAANPHCHLLIRDRDPQTGKRAIGMSDAGSTEMLREKWEQHANRALELAGHDARIDRRSLQAQGIDRAPTIHEGPNVRAMEARGGRPQSRPRLVRNGRGSRKATRRVDYPSIDRGQSRPAYNRSLRRPETEADFWEAIDRDQQRREFAERGLVAGDSRSGKAAENTPSMQSVGRFPLGPQKRGHGVPTAGKVSPFSVPSDLPVRTQRVVRRPGALEPSPDKIARRQGHHDRADIVGPGGISPASGDELFKSGKVEQHSPPQSMDDAHGLSRADEGQSSRKGRAVRPTGAAFRGKRREGRESADHNAIMKEQPGISRESAMSDEDERLQNQHLQERDRLKFQADQSRARFDDLMQRSYRDPKAAEQKMDSYRSKHADDALYDKLAKNPKSFGFGRRPGSMASVRGYQPGADKLREDSLIARRHLPDATRKMHADRERLGGAERAVQNGQSPQQRQLPPKPGRAEYPSPDARQATQHKGLEQPGQPALRSPGSTSEPDWSRMNPEARQANQHRLMEQPIGPAMASPPAGMVGRLMQGPSIGQGNQPQMAPAPESSVGKQPLPGLGKDRGMEM